MRTQHSLLQGAIHFEAAADRVLLRVELRDSRGRLWMKGLMAQLRAAGMLRDSESVRHSATTPSLAASRLQQAFRRHRNPWPSPGGNIFSSGLPGLSTSEI